MKNKTWLWLIFLGLFVAFAIWFLSGNDSATGFRWFAAKGGW